MPTVSIIIPIYNSQKYLREMLDSVLSQTYVDFEALLIDDGSNDNSLSICCSYKSKDKRLKVFHKNNTGPSETRNIGIEKAIGDYIVFWDSDDLVDSCFLSNMVRAVQENDVDLAVCGFEYCNRTKFDIIKTIAVDKAIFFEGGVEFYFGTDGWLYNMLWNKIYKRKIIVDKNIRFRNDLRLGEDIVFTSEYLTCTKAGVVIIEDTLYSYFKREGSITKTDNLKYESIEVQYRIIKQMATSRRMLTELEKKELSNRWLLSFVGCIWKTIEYGKSYAKQSVQDIMDSQSFNECISCSEHSMLNPVLFCLLKNKMSSALILYHNIILKRKRGK